MEIFRTKEEFNKATAEFDSVFRRIPKGQTAMRNYGMQNRRWLIEPPRMLGRLRLILGAGLLFCMLLLIWEMLAP